MPGSSILVKCRCGGGNARRTDERDAQQPGHAAVLPLVRVQNGDAGSNQIYCVVAYCLCLHAAPVDGEPECAAGGTGRGKLNPGERATCRRKVGGTQPAIV